LRIKKSENNARSELEPFYTKRIAWSRSNVPRWNG
jgi:hypothetical protein